MIAATWAWVLAGVAFVIVTGLVVVVALGLLRMPGDLLRRAAQSTGPDRSLPDEVPDATAGETTRLADEERDA